MIVQSYGTTVEHCRRSAIPPCDPTEISAGTNPPAVNNDLMLVRKGDIIDFGFDWSRWIEANGGKLKTSTWAAHGASPQSPTLDEETLIDAAKQHTLFILNAAAATVGHVYYVENTVVIEGVAAGSFVMPDRTLKRVMHIKVVL